MFPTPTELFSNFFLVRHDENIKDSLGLNKSDFVVLTGVLKLKQIETF